MLLGIGFSWAEVRYVGNPEITVRRGPGTDYRITDFLKSGASVDLIQEESGWAEVRFNEGQTGWVLRRYLVAESPPDQMALVETASDLVKKNEGLRAENTRLERLLAQPLPRPSMDDKPSSGELAAAIELGRSLLNQAEEKRRRLEGILTSRGDRTQWFLIGAGTAALGMVLGHLTVRFRRPWSSRH